MRRVFLPRAAGLAAGAVLIWLASITPAAAQYGRPSMSEVPVGEQYHVEALFDFWAPGMTANVSSESLGILGSEIDVKADLGYVDKKIGEFRFVLRPGRKHKFRIAYMPVRYSADSILNRTLVFNGIAFKVGLPIQSEFKWDTWRLGYEYDFVARDWGFVGFFVEARETSVRLSLNSPIDSEFTEARGPVPAIGGVVRVYPHKNVGITAEFGGFNLPEVNNYKGDFFDYDISGTVSFNRYVGVQAGYRSLDGSYIAKHDNGSLKLDGLYFAGVVRF